MKRIAVITLSLLMAGAGVAESSLDAASIEALPITGMSRVTQEDGTIFFISTDHRFVFRGQMLDLWNGDTLDAGVEVSQRIEWNRNGVEIERIAMRTGARTGKFTMFVAPECADCRDLLRVALDRFPDDLNVVLLSSSKNGRRKNQLVWCAKDQVAALRKVYLDGGAPSKGDMKVECDQFGLMMAEQAAMLFGVGQLPMFVDENKFGYTGKGAILAVTK